MGSDREREMVNFFNDNGWAALRVGASGGGTDNNLPDVLAGNGTMCFAIEEKYNAHSKQTTIEDEKGTDIQEFATRFGARALAAVRYSTRLEGVSVADWRVAPLQDVQRTDAGSYRLNHSVSKDWVTLTELVRNVG